MLLYLYKSVLFGPVLLYENMLRDGPSLLVEQEMGTASIRSTALIKMYRINGYI